MQNVTEPRTALVFDSYFDTLGGNQRYICMLLRNRGRDPWRTVLVCPGEGRLTEAARATGAEVFVVEQPARLNRKRAELLRAGMLDKAMTLAAFLSYNLRLLPLLRRLRPDVVQCHGTRNTVMAGFAARLAGVPLLCYIKGEMIDPVLDGLVLRMCDRVAFISDALRPARHRRLFEKHPERFSVLRLGIMLEDIDAAQRRTGAGPPDGVVIEPGTVNFAFAGWLTEAKGVHVLLQAFEAVARRHPECRLHVIGASDNEAYRERLGRLVERLDLGAAVRFLGWRSDVLDVLSVMDAFVLPSLSEGIPRSIVESMALAKPVVATRVGGVDDLLDGGRLGLVVPPDDVGELRDALLRLAGDAALRTTLGERGRAEARARYGFDAHLDARRRTLDALSRPHTPGAAPGLAAARQDIEK